MLSKMKTIIPIYCVCICELIYMKYLEWCLTNRKHLMMTDISIALVIVTIVKQTFTITLDPANSKDLHIRSCLDPKWTSAI